MQRRKVILLSFFVGAVVLVSTMVTAFLWPHGLLEMGYMWLRTPERIEFLNDSIVSIDTKKRFNEQVSVIELQTGTQWFTHNSYASLSFGERSLTELQMTMTAAAPSHFVGKRDRALVIGLASGISAGVAGQLYEHTLVSEINPAVLDVIGQFEERNIGVMSNPNVSVQIQDGVVTLAESEGTYDLIVSSVPSPIYYSASKLWTKEVLQLMNERLSGGGVYSGWFDARLGVRGMRSMLKTLERVFVDCRLMLLSPSYFNTICSNEPLAFNSIPEDAWPDTILHKYAKFSVSDPTAFHEDLLFTLNGEAYYDETVPLNTLDRPVLEFTPPSSYGIEWESAEGEYVIKLVDNIFTETSTTPTALDRRCKHLGVVVTYNPNFRRLFHPVCSDREK